MGALGSGQGSGRDFLLRCPRASGEQGRKSTRAADGPGASAPVRRGPPAALSAGLRHLRPSASSSQAPLRLWARPSPGQEERAAQETAVRRSAALVPGAALGVICSLRSSAEWSRWWCNGTL